MIFLLADDSRTARNILKSMINEVYLGDDPRHDYLEADSGENTLKILKTRNDVDFVFLDWNMLTPMTGLDVLIEIRKIERLKDLPVIMVTSEIEKSHVVTSLKHGASDYIVKPVDIDLLKKKIYKFIKTFE